MTTQTVTRRVTCDRPTAITRSLLGYGVLAGPFYVTVSLTQAFTRDGFDLTRHSWSLLANGGLGWIQVTNFLLTGAMVLTGAVGLHRALPGARWAPRLVGAFGVSMLAAGLLRADPALGFPPGTPDGPGTISWHGAGHLVAGGIGFLCVIAATFALAKRFAADGHRGFAAYSRISGIVFLVGFAGIASGNTAPGFTLFFAAAVVEIFTWLALTAAHLYRTLSPR